MTPSLHPRVQQREGKTERLHSLLYTGRCTGYGGVTATDTTFFPIEATVVLRNCSSNFAGLI